jgi:hypothetical protein
VTLARSRCPYWLLPTAYSLLLFISCLAEDPTSFRDVDTLLTGRWTFPAPEIPPTIDLNPDGTFGTSSGLPGITVLQYHGQFWQADGVLAFRGTGVQGGLHVQYISYSVIESPALSLSLTDIHDDFAANLIGVDDINTLSGNEVNRSLRRFTGISFPPNALGFTEVYDRLGQ